MVFESAAQHMSAHRNRHWALGLALCGAAMVSSGCAGWKSWDDNKARSSPAPAQQRPIGPGEYRVVSGDTMYSIAFRNQLDYRQLARWNGIGDHYLIFPGQVLRLTPPAGESQPKRHITGEIESTPMDDMGIGKPVAINPDSPPPMPMAPPEDPPQTAIGGYQWVVPTQGSVLRRFGQDSNRGIDFGGRDGQAILAAAPGRVVYSGNALKGYGELIIIKHDELYLSAYGYNRERHVKEGDVVTSGQPIGVMGRGPENKPMLHFEIRRSGHPIDPAELLPTVRR